MSKDAYLVQCMFGHVGEVKHDTPLEELCKAREAEGFIDALCLSNAECPQCVENQLERERQGAELNSMFDCGFADVNGNCADDCPCKNPSVIADNPYAGQIGFVTLAWQ